jgi:hypothetical protein
MLGGNYALGQRFTIDAGVIAGHYTASPRFGSRSGFLGPGASTSRPVSGPRSAAGRGPGHALSITLAAPG